MNRLVLLFLCGMILMISNRDFQLFTYLSLLALKDNREDNAKEHGNSSNNKHNIFINSIRHQQQNSCIPSHKE